MLSGPNVGRVLKPKTQQKGVRERFKISRRFSSLKRIRTQSKARVSAIAVRQNRRSQQSQRKAQ